MEPETGAGFARRLKNQVLNAGVEIIYETVTGVALKGEVKSITTAGGVHQAPRIILANGCSPRRLGIPGETELAGKGVCSNAAREAAACRGRNIYVVGGADGAVKEALFLAGYAARLTIIHFEDGLGCIAEFRRKIAAAANIDLRLSSRLGAINGSSRIESLEFVSEKDGHTEIVTDPGCAVFIYAGSTPDTGLYSELELKDGFIITDERMETSIPGVYAAGDIRFKQIRQVATAVADGATAAINAATGY